MNRSRSGQRAEEHARRFLETHGLALVTSNYRSRHGEIDLIMRDGPQLVFVEVRYRRHQHYGGALASIDRRKQARLIHTANRYLQSSGHRGATRFDVVALDARFNIQWIPNAFDAD